MKRLLVYTDHLPICSSIFSERSPFLAEISIIDQIRFLILLCNAVIANSITASFCPQELPQTATNCAPSSENFYSSFSLTQKPLPDLIRPPAQPPFDPCPETRTVRPHRHSAKTAAVRQRDPQNSKTKATVTKLRPGLSSPNQRKTEPPLQTVRSQPRKRIDQKHSEIGYSLAIKRTAVQ
jgi:hypothetical protein